MLFPEKSKVPPFA